MRNRAYLREEKTAMERIEHKDGKCISGAAAPREVETDGRRDPETAPEAVQHPRQPMPEQPPQVRVGNFREVPFGLTPDLAILEATRCIQCKNPQCVKGCPVSVQIPEFIDLVAKGKFIEAARKIKETNALPAVCGRVCPQEEQCEMPCVLGKKGEPVAIGRLERFVADFERVTGNVEIQGSERRRASALPWSGRAPRG